ncbi:hypothetical protein PROPHIGD54-2_12 [Mycobacterium phage prophiGD54-2]|nr:hypothetical protein PROPHIGD54-2_12 [Mycobacterium phage prophiGD54-2]
MSDSPAYLENRTCKACGRFDVLCQCPAPAGARKPWPGWCQNCQAGLIPSDATWCRSCGADDFED